MVSYSCIRKYYVFLRLVLILVVVDNGLVQNRLNAALLRRIVLILIVVDNSLVPYYNASEALFEESLNPYCSGQ